MPELYANQASGLLGLSSRGGPRMLAMVNHGDVQAELPLLWQLCLAIVDFGYSVTVLDATTQESDSNPGLAERMDNDHWRDSTQIDSPAWTVLPSGRGIQALCSAQGQPLNGLQTLGNLFPHDGLVILYCNTDWMTSLIAGTGVEPLVAVSKSRTSLITSYLALKRLLIAGRLRPTIVHMIQDSAPCLDDSEHSTLANLEDCARRFLRQEVRTLHIIEQLNDGGPNDDIQRLALRLIENAVPLDNVNSPLVVNTRVPHYGQIDHFAGSH